MQVENRMRLAITIHVGLPQTCVRVTGCPLLVIALKNRTSAIVWA